jgi:hypothetical protein
MVGVYTTRVLRRLFGLYKEWNWNWPAVQPMLATKDTLGVVYIRVADIITLALCSRYTVHQRWSVPL